MKLNRQPRVLIIADEVSGAGLESILGKQHYVIEQVRHNHGVKKTSEWMPDIILYREESRDVIAVFDTIEKLKLACPNAKVIVIGSFSGAVLIDMIGAVGVTGYLSHADTLSDYIHHAVESALNNKLYFSPTAYSEYLLVVSDWKEQPFHSYLDSESLRVLQLIAAGKTTSQIAEALSRSHRRIYWVREKLRRRFQAETTEKMISIATAAGFVSLVEQ
jgi:DNA-binding NarL/FixJ family response regulator